MTIPKIKKRNGTIVAFEEGKILAAVEKAMLAVRGSSETDAAHSISAHVLKHLEEQFGDDRTPDVEMVQDLVERALMEHGYFDVAKAYIIYRDSHAKLRHAEKDREMEKLRARGISVVMSDGTRTAFNEERLRRSFLYAARGFTDAVDVDALANQCAFAAYDGMPSSELSTAMVLTARSFIERNPEYDTVAARLFLDDLMEEVSGYRALAASENLSLGFSEDVCDAYRRAFKESIVQGVRMQRLDQRMERFDLTVLADALHPERDDLFTYRGLQVLYDRYFLTDGKRRLELPQTFFMRVAMGLALIEAEPERRAIEFYDLISSMRYMPSTPTLFHAGTAHPQLSSCYITTVEDDLTHIFKCIGDNAQLSKWSGGIGNDWTNIRATGALIKGTQVESQGVIPFLKIANDTTVAINRSGKRRGATCAYLEAWHCDIEDFLDLRKNTGDERRRTHDMDTAVWIPDLFMKRVLSDETWTLFSPNDVPQLHHIYGKQFEKQYAAYEKAADEGAFGVWRRIRAKDLWRKMLTMLFETGHPWLTFKDPCNIRSPQDHAGTVHSSNLCTEITLNTTAQETAVCNLGSVQLARHIVNGQLDPKLVSETVHTAMRMLDNVIDINFYPTKEAQTANARHRPVGLGIMGFQDALYALGIRFDSDACLDFADTSMEMISYHAILASSVLAKERGTYQSYNGSKWDRGMFPQDTLDMLEAERGIRIEVAREGKLDWTEVRNAVKAHGMRNSNCMAIAPTATISNITGCNPCIEPVYKNLYVKSNMSGEFTVVNAALVEALRGIGLWDPTMLEMLKHYNGSIQEIAAIPEGIRARFKETFEIAPEWIVRAAARRGKWIDQSQSVNIFMRGTSGAKLSDIYLLAWKLGLKTTYYLRSEAASAVEKSTLDINKWKEVRSNVRASSNPSLTGGDGSLTDIVSTAPKICLIDDPTCEACQ